MTALVNADKLAKQTQITTQTKLVTTKLSGIGTLQSALSSFQALIKPAAGATSKLDFAGYAAKSSDETKVTVTSDNSAVPGNYTVKVNKLATSSSVATAAFSGGSDSAIPSGNLTVTQNWHFQELHHPDRRNTGLRRQADQRRHQDHQHQRQHHHRRQRFTSGAGLDHDR